MSKRNGGITSLDAAFAVADRLIVVEARNAALEAALLRVLAVLRRENSFMSHADQLALREAEALLAEDP